MARFPNPPLTEIDAKDLITARDIGQRWRLSAVTIRQWVSRDLIEPAIPGDPHTAALYWLPALAEAEYETWLNGAYRAWRGGRHPDWRPCRKVAA
jgi:hypothetical protein